jgi:FkbM family methyltransferase
VIKKLIKKIIPVTTRKKWTEKIIVFLSRLNDVNLLRLAFPEIGILKWENFEVSGEKNWIHNELKKLVKSPEPIFLDVGANVGLYSLELRQAFPNSKIVSFEPNPLTYEQLKREVAGRKIEVENLGIGSKEENLRIYAYQNGVVSGHATLYKEMFTERRGQDSLDEFGVQMTTLDRYCERNGIIQVDFLKLDTEGHELEGLRGAKKLLEDKKIKAIQFEFDEMNIFSRIYLKDFYDLLKGYNFFRLDSNRLIPLHNWDPEY